MPPVSPEERVDVDALSSPHGSFVNGNADLKLDDTVVICGVSGRFPESNNVEEFKQQLFDGVDLVTDDERRWPSGIHGLPTRAGKLPHLEHFDASFFGVHAKQADAMDPQLRILLELTYEAIIDAGVCPEDVRGSRTGVFVGASANEADDFWSSDPENVNGYGLLGCCRSMLSNRISFTFDFKGPSYTVDSACSSSMFALQQAVSAIRTGQCDAAIVGGVNLLLKPATSLHAQRLNMLSPEGMCKSFDAAGNGCIRSEAAVIVYLQRSSQAKRIYATVVNAKTSNDGAKEHGITFPSSPMQRKLIRETYAEVNINPADVAYVEAHGTGTKAGDPQEANSIADVFCKGRSSPLIFGSVKSNMGHSEAASGLAGLTKILISMESGSIPGNLHFIKPNPEIPALLDGRLQVVDKVQPWKGGLVGLNSFGFGGANAHVILRSNSEPKLPSMQNNIPCVIGVSGRTEDAVNYKLTKVGEMPANDNLNGLIHGIYNKHISGHNYRGYSVLGAATPQKEIEEFSGEKRPVWYVFSGMGSQWAGMAKTFTQLKVFQDAISKCAEALRVEGFDLISVLNTENESVFENVLNSFVCIAAMHVALVDVLTAVGISPDGMIGHSIGELGCAYADGTLTAEQTVLAAFWRGRSILESKLPPGSMAAVGLSWEETKAQVPDDIFAACHNSVDSVTVSGPAVSISNFTNLLKSKGIFAKEVNSSGVAFHSKYIAEAAPQLQKSLEKVIPCPISRSARWISSSVAECAWGTALAGHSSADYHVNNFLSPVLFHDALAFIPSDAVVIEIAPHGLLQSILKRSLGSDCVNVSLLKKGTNSNISTLLSSLGKLYNAGLNPVFSNLYPPVKFPVPRGTPMLQSHIKWDHSTEWTVPSFAGKGSTFSGDSVVEVDVSKEEDSYLAGHAIDGRLIFPSAGLLVLVWKTFAKLNGKSAEELAVVFEDIHFRQIIYLPENGRIKFVINILTVSGEFEIIENGFVAMSGKIRIAEDVDKEQLTLIEPTNADTQKFSLKMHDIYKYLRLRGFDYGGVFRGVQEADIKGVRGKLLWFDNWVSYIDSVLQFSYLGSNLPQPYLPARIQQISISPLKHFQFLESAPGKEESIPVLRYKLIEVIKSGGVEIRGLELSSAVQRCQTQAAPKLEQFTFVPYIMDKVAQSLSDFNALTACLQIVLENSSGAIKMKVTEVAANRQPDELMAAHIVKIFESEPLITTNVTVVSNTPEAFAGTFEPLGIKTAMKDVTAGPIDQNCHLVVASDHLNSSTVVVNMAASLKQGGFLLFKEKSAIDEAAIQRTSLDLISKIHTSNHTYVLLKAPVHSSFSIVVNISENNFSWVSELTRALKRSETEGTKVLVVAQGDPDSGIIGMMNCIKEEPGGVNFRAVFVQDVDAPEFSLTETLFVTQLNKDLFFNVYKNKQWGSLRHLTLGIELKDASQNIEHAFISTRMHGDLSSLSWIEGPLSSFRPDLQPDKELCRVYCASVSFYDTSLAKGKLPQGSLKDFARQDCILGEEFAGCDTKGGRVMGIVATGGLATSVLADPAYLWEVPEKWSLSKAATIPIAYSTVYCALIVRGRMKSGESLLVLGGTDGFGLAAITIALHMNCVVFTTVETKEAREYLKETFPQLHDRNIVDTCQRTSDTSFVQHVMMETEGCGVDVVLNSVAGEMSSALRCLAKNGRFCKIGNLDITVDSFSGSSIFLKNITFHGISSGFLFDDSCSNVEKQEVVRLMKEGLQNGSIRPLPATIFPEDQVKQAFCLADSNEVIGKVVLRICDEEQRKTQSPAQELISAIPRTYMNPDKTYVLTGGLGGVGLELANWLIDRGVMKIVLCSRSGICNGYQSLYVRRWQERGVNVVISTSDCSSVQETTKLLEEASQLGPVGGIFNLAAVLHDALLPDLTPADFMKVAMPKINVTKNLDNVSRKLCPHLDHFVAFSSVSCGRGNIGQTNYGFANSALERICEARHSAGLPAVAIQWGAIGDVGILLDSRGGGNNDVFRGTLPQRISSCLMVMDNFLQQPHSALASTVIAGKGRGSSDGTPVSITDAVANILGVKNLRRVNKSVPLFDLGMDSLMGSEIKQVLECKYDLVLSAQEIRSLTFSKLSELQSSSCEDDTPIKGFS